MTSSPFLRALHTILAEELFWTANAACAGQPTSVFFVDKGGPTGKAKAICRPCSVRIECLAYALKIGERHGVWGGLAYKERRYYTKLRLGGMSHDDALTIADPATVMCGTEDEPSSSPTNQPPPNPER